MLQVGITGNLGSGKSTVAAIFKQLGIPVFNADDAAKWLMCNNSGLKKEIIALFGWEAYLPNGNLNRAHIASLAFNNQLLLNQLNALVHPQVQIHYKNWVSKQDLDTRFVLKEAALLIESKSYLDLDKLIVVAADEETLIARGMQRDNASRAQIQERLAKQIPQSEKIKLADFVIYNNHNNAVLPQLWDVYNTLLRI
jgi:dephospho-CoA kinase